MQTERNIAGGMSRDEARRAALVAFGGRERFGEAARDEVRSLPLEELHRDCALEPACSPWRARVRGRRDPHAGARHWRYLAWRKRCTACEDIGALIHLELTLRGEGDPQRVTAARASANLLPMLGARAQLGRLFTEAADADGVGRVAVLADGFWRRQYGGRADIIGRTIRLDGQPTVVVGVLARGFALPRGRELGSTGPFEGAVDVIIPFALTQGERITPGNFSYAVIARLVPGPTAERAQAEFETVAG
jgi:hypothetical protein